MIRETAHGRRGHLAHIVQYGRWFLQLSYACCRAARPQPSLSHGEAVGPASFDQPPDHGVRRQPNHTPDPDNPHCSPDCQVHDLAFEEQVDALQAASLESAMLSSGDWPWHMGSRKHLPNVARGTEIIPRTNASPMDTLPQRRSLRRTRPDPNRINLPDLPARVPINSPCSLSVRRRMLSRPGYPWYVSCQVV